MEAIYEGVCAGFPHLGPFLARADFAFGDDGAALTFSATVPGIIREELEQEFSTALGRQLARTVERPVAVRFSFSEEETAVSERDQVKENPLVKFVLDAFDGDIEAITDKEK